MPHVTLRAAAAAIAFLLGLASVWLSGLLVPAEDWVAERLVPTSDINVTAAPLVGREEAETQKVYEAVLREVFGGYDDTRLFVIRSETATDPFTEGEARDFAGPEYETARDFSARNRVPRRLSPLPGLKARQVFLDAEEYESMFRPRDVNGWQVFYRRFPNSPGYITLSAVGFNRAGDEAFLYAAKSCGYLCGEGWHLILKKRTYGWEIERRRMVWVS